uniref:Uncharacterized protein n=1 Tax=Halimeda minima TaxID=170427 RepID=A0A386AYZ5_9CHLO|nr:hypothetical protein [Halimeda minima]
MAKPREQSLIILIVKIFCKILKLSEAELSPHRGLDICILEYLCQNNKIVWFSACREPSLFLLFINSSLIQYFFFNVNEFPAVLFVKKIDRYRKTGFGFLIHNNLLIARPLVPLWLLCTSWLCSQRS